MYLSEIWNSEEVKFKICFSLRNKINVGTFSIQMMSGLDEFQFSFQSVIIDLQGIIAMLKYVCIN